MDTKRDAIGVVDAINAEDIGKFPDTNLSESLQRITGVSIDRRNGEGATVTARGFGPQFNMVTLNGRQMPAADAFANGAPTTGGVVRATHARSISRTSRPRRSARSRSTRPAVPTSPPAASARSINVRTARPFDNDGLVLNIGVKALNDTTNRVGDDFTPELSGIFSYANDDKTFGVGLSASYQKRDSGSSSSTVNDWHIQPWNTDARRESQRHAAVRRHQRHAVLSRTMTSSTADHRQRAGAMASCTAFPMTSATLLGSERERINGQLTVQFAPIEGLTLTADYTYRAERDHRGSRRADHLAAAQWLRPHRVRHQRSGGDAGAAARVHRRQQGLRLRAAASRAEERAEFDRLQLRLGRSATTSRSASTSTTRRPAACRTIRSPAAAKRRSASRARCRAPASSLRAESRRSGRHIPAAMRRISGRRRSSSTMACRSRRARCSRIAVRGLCRHGRRCELRVLGAASLGSQVLRIAYQDQTTDIKQARIDGKFEYRRRRTLGSASRRARWIRDSVLRAANMRFGRLGRGRQRHRARHGGVADAVQPHRRIRRLHPVGAPTRRLERQCERARPVGARPRLHQLDRELGARWRAALQPGLQHRQHRDRRHAGGVCAVRASSSSSAACRRTCWSARATRKPT